MQVVGFYILDYTIIHVMSRNCPTLLNARTGLLLPLPELLLGDQRQEAD